MSSVIMEINKNKFKIFLEVTKALNESFNIIPILYGSLGLYRVIGEYGESHDIDILVPDEFVNKKWDELIDLMKKREFKLKDKHEHEFIRDSEIVAFAREEDLNERIGLNPNSLKVSSSDNIRFKELSAENYLSVYRFMLRDDYRQEKRGKADREKINLIKEYISRKTRINQG